jgi:hypothetical protein
MKPESKRQKSLKEKEDRLKEELLQPPDWEDLEAMIESDSQIELDYMDTYKSPDDILTIRQKHKLRGLKVFYFWALISLIIGIILGIYIFFFNSNESYLKIAYIGLLATIIPILGSIILVQISILNLNLANNFNPVITQKQFEARIGLKAIRKWYIFIIAIIILGLVMDYITFYAETDFYRVLFMIVFFGSAILSLIFKEEIFLGEFLG